MKETTTFGQCDKSFMKRKFTVIWVTAIKTGTIQNLTQVTAHLKKE